MTMFDRPGTGALPLYEPAQNHAAANCLPDKDFEEDDPYELVAVRLPSPPGHDGPAEMARCFIEEFALMGWSPERILRLFRSKAFAGANSVYEERGEPFIRDLLADVFGRKVRAPAIDDTLPMLEHTQTPQSKGGGRDGEGT
ncbi:MAG: hypothetical protein U0531_07080 [Dehalococcoidia bacterium]